MREAVYARNVQASEKVYMDLRLEVRNPGGHSSLAGQGQRDLPSRAALVAGGGLRIPVRLNEVTRAFFGAGRGGPGTIAARMRMIGETGDTTACGGWRQARRFNAVLRTTCVATRLEGGHAKTRCPRWRRPTSTAACCRTRGRRT